MTDPAPRTGLVLSGGGMRGAYEAGVLHGIVEVLKRSARDAPLFQILAGTSVGAINAAYLAANAEYGDHAIGRLLRIWTGLRLDLHAKVRPLGLLRLPKTAREFAMSALSLRPLGASLLDSRPIEEIVKKEIDWPRLHANVASGRVSAVIVAALHVVSGRTAVFVEKPDALPFEPSRDERRVTRFESIEAEHVLASAALPLLFPTRRVGEHFYCDGGLRFNTPISPAIRAGAERLVVISVRHRRSESEFSSVEAAAAADDQLGRDLSVAFLVGKLLNALLLDPVSYDLQVLERLNNMVDAMQHSMDSDSLRRVENVWIQSRGAPYRKLKTLIFTPSEDLGYVAGDYLRFSENLAGTRPFIHRLLRWQMRDRLRREADWASYLMFDGGFAARLIALGRRDAYSKADEIRAFFAQ